MRKSIQKEFGGVTHFKLKRGIGSKERETIS